jgi:hypothetical protein
MKLGTSLADHRFIGGIRITRLGFVQRVLNVQSSAGTSEDDVVHKYLRIGVAADWILISIKFVRATVRGAAFDRLRTPKGKRRQDSRFADESSIERFGNDTDAENGPLRFIEQFHVPLGILFELAGNACRHVGTGAGQCLPRSITVGAFGPEFGRT